jgi:hypothetical protein
VSRSKAPTATRWIIRLASIPSLCFFIGILYMIGSWGWSGEEGEPLYSDFWLCYLGPVVGLVMGWKWPLLGGALTLFALASAIFIEVSRVGLGAAMIINPFFLMWYSPAVLFLVQGLVQRRRSRSTADLSMEPDGAARRR